MSGWHTNHWRCRLHALVGSPIGWLRRLGDRIDPPGRHTWTGPTHRGVHSSITTEWRLFVDEDGQIRTERIP